MCLWVHINLCFHTRVTAPEGMLAFCPTAVADGKVWREGVSEGLKTQEKGQEKSQSLQIMMKM